MNTFTTQNLVLGVLLAASASTNLVLVAGDNNNNNKVGNQTMSGAFYAVYPNGTAAAPECVVDAGTKVDTSCCAELTPQPLLATLTNDNTCFTFTGDIRAFKGCDGTTSTYGEFCERGTATNNETIDECGCMFKLAGTGCYKANDFPDDPRQFFVYLDDEHDCPAAEDSGPSSTRALVGAATFLVSTLIALVM